MNKITVNHRLGIVTAIVAAVLLGVGAAGLLGVRLASSSLQRMFEGRAMSLQLVSTIDELVTETTFSVSDAILDPSAQKTQSVTAAATANVTRIDALMKQYLADDLAPDERRLAAQFASHWSTLRDKGFRPAVALLAANNLSEAQWAETQTIEPAAKATKADSTELRKLALQSAQQEYDHSRTTGHIVQTTVIVFFAAGLGIVALACAAMARSLSRELGGEPSVAADIARRVAGGDLAVNVPVRPGDTRSVLFAMETMRARLASMVGAIRASTETIADASAHIASGNSMLASRTEAQAAGIEQTSASLAQLASTVKANAGHAERARQLAGTASGKAEDGDRAAREAASRMTALAQQSARIHEITAVIESIAFQTNLLALNAAVEAARAGSHGRGFAVVAQEVRALAERSAGAAKEIDGLISGMVSEVDQSGAAVGLAGTTIVELIAAVSGVSELIGSIAAASTQQSGSIDEVNAAVSMMDRATQQNASFAQEGVQSASALETHARHLRSAVHVFQLERCA